MNDKQFKKILTVTLLGAAGLAVVSFVAGTMLPAPAGIGIAAFLQEHLGKIEFSFWGIFRNNLTAALILFLGGFLICLPSIFSYVFNFVALGALLQMTKHTIGTKTFLLSVVPHGIIEIPAITIAFAFGLMLAYGVIRALAYKKGAELVNLMKRLAILFITIVIPLLAVAAFIEVNLTLGIVKGWK